MLDVSSNQAMVRTIFATANAEGNRRAAPSSDQAGARLFLGGLPIAFDLGSILVVAAHLVILGSVVLARRAARERPS